MTRLSYLFVIVSVACLCSPAAAETYVVNPEGTGDYETIQAAIWSADNGDVIELTDGTFTGEFNRDLTYEGKSITVRSQSGNPEACIIDCEGSVTELRRGFSFVNEEGPGAILEGITITGGYVEWTCGGAMRIRSNSSPTINNCRIIDNHGECIGGVFLQYGSPTLTDCVFEGNSTASSNGDGGGFFAGQSCAPVLTRCTFRGNSTDRGGGVFARFDADVTLIDCLFVDNTAGSGGGLYCMNDAIVVVENCTFAGNEAPTGGNILCNDQASLTVTNSILANSVGGDAIECEGTSLATLSCCDVWGNTGGDWVGCIAGQDGVDGNISVDPCFCLDSYYIAETSPCAAANNTCGLLIGALDEQCVDCGGDVPTLETTWGQLKAGYR